MADNTSNSKSSTSHPRDGDGKFADKDHAKPSGAHSGSGAKDASAKSSPPSSSKDDSKGSHNAGSKDSKTDMTGRSK